MDSETRSAEGVKGRKRLALLYSLLIVISVLFLCKVISFPVAFMLVVGRSMEPTYRVGDLVIGVATYLRGFSVGDVVVWCRDFWRTACVVHRVVRVSGEYVVTQGDANPGPDTPVLSSAVSYVVVAHVPAYVWLPLVVLAVGSTGYFSYRESGKRLSVQPGLVAIALVATYIVINAAILGFTYIDNSPPFYYTPRVELLSAHLDPVKMVYVVEINTTEYSFVEAVCKLLGEIPAAVVGVANGSITRLSIHIPAEFFSYLWNRTSARGVSFLPSPPVAVQESFSISCSVVFDKATLSGNYIAAFSWREPVVKSFNDTLIIENVNPVPLVLRIELFSKARGSTVFAREYRVERFSTLAIDFSNVAPAPGDYDARVYYTFLGVVRGQGARIVIK